MYCTQYDAPIGKLLLTCTDRGLTGIYLNRQAPLQQEEHPILRQAEVWLDAYFRGECLPVEIPLAPEGTAFQKQVWQLLLDIPYGETCTYGDLAKKMAVITGKEKMSAQAVGQAVGANPINILVPCHRVVGAGGKLTGYGGGLPNKAWLLRHEGWLK